MKIKNLKLKSIAVAALFCSTVSFISCKKMLEVKPYSLFTTANFFSDIEEANMATLGVYEIMSALETYGWYVPMLYDNDTDLSQIDGAVLTPEWRAVPKNAATSETIYFYETWSLYYRGIDRANVVIEQIPQMPLFNSGTEAQKAQLNTLLGEAKFLRAFYYSELVRLWGDVPFKITSSKAGEVLKLGLTDRYVIYEQVIKDMQEAAGLLPAALSVNERVNKWAAKAMLARIAVFAGGYSLRANGLMERPVNYKDYYRLAQQEIDDIMANNPYKLNQDYTQVFKNQCKHILEPTESIFEVSFYNPAGQRGNGSYFGVWNTPTTAVGTYLLGSGRIKTIKTFYESFKAGDLRRDFAIATYSITATGTKTPLNTGRQDEQWTVGKWSREYQNNNSIESGYTSINYVSMRYSDLLLLRAEVENELSDTGPNDKAYTAINMVRRRAYGKPVETADAAVDIPVGLTQLQFFEAVKNERAWELCFEGMRRADLIRWNALGTTLRDTRTKVSAIRANYNYVCADNFVDGKHELYPFPLNEMGVNNAITRQNPQW